MALTLKPFDASEYLDDDETIAMYLEEASVDNDPALIMKALGNIARAHNMTKLSENTGISRRGLYKALSGEGNPSFDTVHKVAEALGLQVTFRPAPVETTVGGPPKIRARNSISTPAGKSSGSGLLSVHAASGKERSTQRAAAKPRAASPPAARKATIAKNVTTVAASTRNKS